MIFYLFYLIVLLVVGITSYAVAPNFIYTIIITLLFLSFFMAIEFSYKKKRIIERRKMNDLNLFIRDFLNVYMARYNIDEAIKQASSNVSSELQEEIKMTVEFKGIERLNNLSKYFSSNLFDLLLISIKNKKNNNSLSYIARENELDLERKNNATNEIKKTVLEYSILWVIAFLILIAMRFAIHNYFLTISNSVFYYIGISMFFILFMASIYMFIKESVKIYE